jgi:hypothetical protein
VTHGAAQIVVHDYLGRFAFADSRNPPLRADVHMSQPLAPITPRLTGICGFKCDSDYGTVSQESDQVLLAGTPEFGLAGGLVGGQR